MKTLGRGLVICGGGYKYFSNAWVCARLLRRFGSELPVELWIWDYEFDPRLVTWLEPYNVQIRIAAAPQKPGGVYRKTHVGSGR